MPTSGVEYSNDTNNITNREPEMIDLSRLKCGETYHIWNRGVNRCRIFRREANYRFFMQKYLEYIEPVALTHAFCLIPNHFHTAIRTRTPAEQEKYHSELVGAGLTSDPFEFCEPSEAFRSFFISYVRSVNNEWNRTGGLFERRFGRNPVTTQSYLENLIVYIHRNPETHGLVNDFRQWPYSSYGLLLSPVDTFLNRDEVLDWYGGPAGFMAAHQDPDVWKLLDLPQNLQPHTAS